MVTMNSRQVVEQAALMPRFLDSNTAHYNGFDRVMVAFSDLGDAEMFLMFAIPKTQGYRSIVSRADLHLHMVTVDARPAR